LYLTSSTYFQSAAVIGRRNANSPPAQSRVRWQQAKKRKHMTNRILNLTFILFLLLTSCSKESSDISPASSSSNGQGNSGNQAGVITAGEWNDLDNWSFWENLISTDEFKSKPQYWTIFNNNRIAVKVVTPDESPIIDALVKLKRDGTTVFTARTDNKGKAELWNDIFQNNTNSDFSKLTIDINNGTNVLSNIKPYKDGTNKIVIPATTVDNKIEISFVVDATGSMGDEIEYLKTELLDVISRIKTANPNSTVLTSSVFYRDEGDDYLTRVSNLTSDINTTINFIKNQSVGGGGDFPEAVHSALDKAVNELQWSNNAKTRILFLVLDAPPHHNNSVISNIQTSLLKTAEKGIKIIPITASGIDKETEFLMRFLAMTTTGTYVFITDDSGIGNSHLQASVGEYQVEYLNNLMVRLINKYAE
jgi:hypothetical protein